MDNNLDYVFETELMKYAAQHYYTPRGIDVEEFYTDLKRFKYVKRLLNRYQECGNLSERLILNHLIIIFNVFGSEAGLKILNTKIDKELWHVLKPFLIFLNVIRNDEYTNITMDKFTVEKLREIRKC